MIRRIRPRAGEQLTNTARERLRQQTVNAMQDKGVAWPVARIWLARDMGWTLEYVDRLRHNKPNEIKRAMTIIQTERSFIDRQMRRGGPR